MRQRPSGQLSLTLMTASGSSMAASQVMAPFQHIVRLSSFLLDVAQSSVIDGTSLLIEFAPHSIAQARSRMQAVRR